MTDCVTIAAELPFRQQVIEFATHLSRSLPSASEGSSQREFIASYETQLPDGEDDVPPETRQAVIKNIVEKVGELRGGIEGLKESERKLISEPESANLSLLHLLSSNFSGAEFDSLYKSVIGSVQKGGEANVANGRYSRAEAACRILNNAYNFLPTSSPLRPTTLLALLALLARLHDLSSLPLTPAFLTAALSEWSLSPEGKVDFLKSASSIFQSSNELSRASELLNLALRISPSPELVASAIAVSLAREDSFDLDGVLSVSAAKDAITGKLAELVKLFTEADELEAVPAGASWAAANGDFIKGLGVAQVTPESVVRKLRLIALVTLCARATSKVLSYGEVAKALNVEENEVEVWVIDAIRANILQARLSQPTSQIRITSVTKAGTRRFGRDEWQLLERRLQEWQKSVTEARKVVEEASEVAAQAPPPRKRREGGEQGQSQQQQREEITA